MNLPIPGRNKSNWFTRTISWLPVAMTMGIILWSGYIFFFEGSSFLMQSETTRRLLISVTGLILILLVTSYIQAIINTSKEIPDAFKIPEEAYTSIIESAEPNRVLHQYGGHLRLHTSNLDGSIRFCDKCKCIKPDRTHHCSVCKRCILKMDHHCPWINNCVCYANYKFFVLLLFYSIVYCVLIISSFFPYIYGWENKVAMKFNVLFLFFVANIFAVTSCCLFCYHCYLIHYNRTTLESVKKPVFKNSTVSCSYSGGFLINIKDVFGANPLLWLIPVFTSMGDGTTFNVYYDNGEYFSLA